MGTVRRSVRAVKPDVPEALVHFLIHGTHAPTDMEGAFEAFQLANPRNNYEALRPVWAACRAVILAAHPNAWGRRLDRQGRTL